MPRVIRRVWYVFRPDLFVVRLLLRLEESREHLLSRSPGVGALMDTAISSRSRYMSFLRFSEIPKRFSEKELGLEAVGCEQADRTRRIS